MHISMCQWASDIDRERESEKKVNRKYIFAISTVWCGPAMFPFDFGRHLNHLMAVVIQTANSKTATVCSCGFAFLVFFFNKAKCL